MDELEGEVSDLEDTMSAGFGDEDEGLIEGNVDVEIDEDEEDEEETMVVGEAIEGEMDIEIEEGQQETTTWYFSVSVWRGRELLGNNNGGKTSDPYVLVKYGEQELKTRVMERTLDPVWKSHVMFAYDASVETVELYVLDYEDFTSDDLLGKVSLRLPRAMPDDVPVFNVLDHEWLEVQPCLTEEQDELLTFKNTLTRRATKVLRVFHDDAHLYKKRTLGEINVSINAFKLEDLPALVRDREATIQTLRLKLSNQRKLSRAELADAHGKLESELTAARADAKSARAELRVQFDKRRSLDTELAQLKAESAKTQHALNDAVTLKQALLRERADLEQIARDRLVFAQDLRAQLDQASKAVSTAENERDALLIKLRKHESKTLSNRYLANVSSSPKSSDDSSNLPHGVLDDLSVNDLKARIQGLTLAYYRKLRAPPGAQMDDHFRAAVNANSLPSDPPLRLLRKPFPPDAHGGGGASSSGGASTSPSSSS